MTHFHWWDKRFDRFVGRWYRTCEVCGKVEVRRGFRWRPW